MEFNNQYIYAISINSRYGEQLNTYLWQFTQASPTLTQIALAYFDRQNPTIAYKIRQISATDPQLDAKVAEICAGVGIGFNYLAVTRENIELISNN